MHILRILLVGLSQALLNQQTFATDQGANPFLNNVNLMPVKEGQALLSVTSVPSASVRVYKKFTTPPSSVPISEEIDQPEETLEVCEDRLPNCRESRNLCGEQLYRSIMMRECEKTCGYCSMPGEDKCEDKDYECPKRIKLCTQPMYRSVMEENCPRTCGLCAVQDLRREMKAKQELAMMKEINEKKRRIDCKDRLPNCQERAFLCKRQSFARRMARDCPKTCNLC